MTRIQFGFILPFGPRQKEQRATFVADLDRALELVAPHFDSVWMIDHLQAGSDDLLEGWTTLTYLAARHPQLKFGHTVLCQSFRNPALLAKMAATLQFLSGGRFILGLGAGWDEAEYRAYGYDFPPAGVRVEQLEETIQIIQAMWTTEQATFDGKHYRVEAASCEPKPEPLPPLLIGAFRPRMLRLTAQYADWWDVSSTGIAKYRRLAADLEQACATFGRDPATVQRSWSGGFYCSSDEQQVRTVAEELYSHDDDPDDFNLVGTPAQIVAQMRSFIELGIDHFMLDCGSFPDLTPLHLLINEVLPVLNKERAE